MSKVYTGASMSLNGDIAGPADTGFEHLFKWYGNGDVVVPTTHPELTMRMSAVSASRGDGAHRSWWRAVARSGRRRLPMPR
jgi:hypothetical protein